MVSLRKVFLSSVTAKLILINVVLFLVSLPFLYSNKYLGYFALTPSLILQGKNLWTIFTSMFFHANLFHLFANMFSLFFIGTFVERLIGKKRFIWVYLVSGVVGSLAFILSGVFLGDPNMPGLGASGALFGLIGILAVLVPRTKIYLIVGPLILLFFEFTLGAMFPWLNIVIEVLFILMIFAMLSFDERIRRFAIPVGMHMWLLPIVAIVPLVVVDYFVDLPIGNSAHFGGLVVGLVYGLFLRRLYPRKTKRISRIYADGN
jgi:membrane associated rhomboid family serine protease